MPWKRILSIAGAFCALLAGENVARAVILQVPSEYSTIQEAINAGTDGDTVLVAPGIYAGDGNRDIDFTGKALTVTSENGPESCIIQCGGRYSVSGLEEYHRGFHFHSHEDANSIVQGFTVTQGYVGPEDGGGFLCRESSPTIRDCIIVGNAARDGGGMYAYLSDIRIETCIIKENIASYSPRNWYYRNGDSEGGGVFVGQGDSLISNCLIVGNISTHQGGGVYCGNGDHRIVNCTITGNRTGESGIGGGISFGGSDWDISHLHSSIVWGNLADDLGNDMDLKGDPLPGVMKVSIVGSLVGEDSDDVYDPHARTSGEYLMADPSFAISGYWDPNDTPDDPGDDFWVDGDYHLKSQAGRRDPASGSWVQDDITSPCVDAGDPNTPIMYEPFPNGGIVNMGAYGGTAEASKSYFGQPVCETIVAGDINGDCKVDMKDLVLLISHWTEE